MFLAIHIDKNYKANFGWFFVFISTKNVVLFSWNFIPCNPIYRKKTHLIWEVNFMHHISSPIHSCNPLDGNSSHYNHIYSLTFINFHWLYYKNKQCFWKNCIFTMLITTKCWWWYTQFDHNDDHMFACVCIFPIMVCRVGVMSWISFHLTPHM
jgi:hypothetical protein